MEADAGLVPAARRRVLSVGHPGHPVDLDEAAHRLNTQFARTDKPALMTGAQLALRQLDAAHQNPKAKCPFVPQREMVKKLWGTDADPLAHKSDWEKRLAKVSKHHRDKH